jgi:TrmH family RNA methyltransferase
MVSKSWHKKVYMFTKTHAKYIQSLHDKKLRDEYGVFFAEGPKVVADLLQTGIFACTMLAATDNWLQTNQGWLSKAPIGQVFAIKDFELEKISALSQPNQVLAVFEQRPPAQIAAQGQITILLDGLQDPGNLGTILRTADWFGVPNMVCTPNCADIYNPKVVQGTMGSLGRVNVLYTEALPWLQQQINVPLYATALTGSPLRQYGPITEGIIIIGNESKGVSPALLQMATHTINIPGKGKAESLNAAVALGIVLAQLVG